MATTYDALNTGDNRVLVPPYTVGDSVTQSLESGQTIDTTTLVATDFQRLFEVPDGAKLKLLFLKSDDGDTGANLDMDIILRDDDGDTVLLNGGASFQAAYDDVLFLSNQYVNASNTGRAYVGFEVVTAAATGNASMGVEGALVYQ